MRYALSALLALSLAGVPALVGGCEETVEHEKKIEVKDDGTTVKEETTVTEDADGDITKTESKEVDKPND